MNVLTLLFLRMTLWCFLGATTLHAVSPQQTPKNKITQVYHHEGPLVHEAVFYCDQQPIINHIPDADWQSSLRSKAMADKTADSAEKPVEHYRFFMPYTSLDTKKFQDALAKLAQQPGYRVTFTPATTPLPGLTCMVHVDPEKIGFQVETFETITGAKAIAFKFLQRTSMKNINNQSHPLIRTADAALVKKNCIFS